MNAKLTTRFALIILTLAVVLGNTPDAFSQTTNGNGGATDVGTWYEQIFPLAPPGPYDQWDSIHFGMNNLPLIDWSVLSGTTTSYSGTFSQYDSSNSTVIANDMAALAAAKIDFIVIDMSNGGLGGIASGNDWTATYAGAVLAGAAAWNASNSWKIKVAFAIGDPQGAPGPTIEAQAQDVYNNYANTSTYGTPNNWYQINGKPLLVIYSATASTWSSYCSGGGTCTYGNHFQFEYANRQGAGQWGWFLPPSGTQVDPAGLVEQVSPGWIAYPTYGNPVDPRNDGAYYANNWNVVFNNPHPRIVMLTAYNDWLEQQGFWINDTVSPSYYPSPLTSVNDSKARLPEVWTGPDGNVTLDGYWKYTVAAINYLRNGGTKPYWPQAAPNIAPRGTATASSTVDYSTFAVSHVNDGNPGSAWSSAGHSSGNATEWIQIHNPSNPTFNTVVLMGRTDVPNCFPVNFQIQVRNGSSWLTRVQETNFPQPSVPGTPIAFTWGFSDTTTDVRILATQLSPDPLGGYYMQLGEFEVMNEGSTATAPMFANWGFEQPAQGGADDSSGNPYKYGPFTNGWTFNASAGVQQVGSAWQSYMPPQGVQAAFLQGPSSSISQSITLPAGSYTIRFLASQRSAVGGAQAIKVYYDSTQIESVTSIPVNWTPYVTSSFTSTGGSHTITFNGVNSGDSTAFIDEVQIFNQ